MERINQQIKSGSKIMKTKSMLAILATAVSLMGAPAFALDTTETFGVGVLTDFEAYYGRSHSSEGRGNSLNLLMGGGITENFSYSVSGGFAETSDSAEVSGLVMGLIWTVIGGDSFAADIMPYGSYTSQKTSGEMSYPGFESYSVGADLELNFMFFKAFQPYFLAGYCYEYDSNTEDGKWSAPLTLGVLHPVSEGVEFLAQFSATPCRAGKWDTIDRSISAGVNFMLTEKVEVITEAGWEMTAKEFSTSIGVIYAL
jgi:hypothetical protein